LLILQKKETTRDIREIGNNSSLLTKESGKNDCVFSDIKTRLFMIEMTFKGKNKTCTVGYNVDVYLL